MSHTVSGVIAGFALFFAFMVTFLYWNLPSRAAELGEDHFWIGMAAAFFGPLAIMAILGIILTSRWTQ